MSTGKSLAMLPLFVRDYITATRHLTVAERGAYTDLLFFQWEMETLPREPERLARLIGCSAEEFAPLWGSIQTKFSQVAEGLRNPRLEQHREKAMQLSSKRAEVGRLGGKQSGKQRASKRQAIAQANGQAKSNSPSPSPSPSPDSGLSFGESRPPRRTAPAFHQEVIATYHELLPNLPAIKDWPERRRCKLDARIRERLAAGKPADTIAYWRELFAKVAASDFLCGRKTDWRCPGLEWLLEPRNFTKLIEGAHDNHSRNGNGAAYAR